jgi:hypothetical protein
MNSRRLILALTSEEDRNREEPVMSVLAHKRTCAPQKAIRITPNRDRKSGFPHKVRFTRKGTRAVH